MIKFSRWLAGVRAAALAARSCLLCGGCSTAAQFSVCSCTFALTASSGCLSKRDHRHSKEREKVHHIRVLFEFLSRLHLPESHAEAGPPVTAAPACSKHLAVTALQTLTKANNEAFLQSQPAL